MGALIVSVAYEIFSEFYDQYIQDTAPQLHHRYADLVKMLIEKFKINTQSILDASCGTGILIKILEHENYDRIEGMDSSYQMLCKAKQKGIKTYYEDIIDFNIGKKFDVIVSFDSLGHITDSGNLECLFRSVSHHINDGGLFICDGGTREKAQKMHGQIYTYNSEEYSFVWNNYGSNELVNVELIISEKKTGNTFIEKFNLLGHDIEDVVAAAKDSGLKVIFATLEPLVKANGSFVICFAKIPSMQ